MVAFAGTGRRQDSAPRPASAHGRDQCSLVDIWITDCLEKTRLIRPLGFFQGSQLICGG